VMAETTVWWSAVERLVSLLRVHPSLIGSVDVHTGWPGDLHRKPEMVFVDELSSTEDRPVMKSGRQVRDESFRLPLIVVITGRGDLDSTLCRTSAVVAAIQDVLADEPALSDLDGVLFTWVAEKSMSCGQTPEGPIGTARVVVDVTARLN